MLVNLSEKPRSFTKASKHVRDVMKHRWDGLDKGFIRYIKATRGFKCFEKYKPTGYEFTEDCTSNFTGCYFYLCGYTDEHEAIRAYTNQVPIMFENLLDYDPGTYEYWDCYGLCDNAEQAIRFYNQRKSEGMYPGNHVILLTPMTGSFRWHKQGKYIGNFTPTCEYFDDEDGIKLVYSFHIIHVR